MILHVSIDLQPWNIMLDKDTSLDVNTSETQCLKHNTIASPAKRKDLG